VAKTAAPPESLPDVKDMDLLERMLVNVRKDIKAMDVEIKAKEREWNLLIHKKKKMEEQYLRLKRKREVESLESTGLLPAAPAPAQVSPAVVKPMTSVSTNCGDNTVSIISGMSGGKVKTVTTSVPPVSAAFSLPENPSIDGSGKDGSFLMSKSRMIMGNRVLVSSIEHGINAGLRS
jgi:hypothetical protein